MKKNKGIKILSILLIIISIAMIGGGVFYNLYGNSSNSTKKENNSTDDKSKEKSGCGRIDLTINGYSFVLGEVDYDEFMKNTGFKFAENYATFDDGKKDEYLNDGYSQIFISRNKNNKIYSFGIGNNLDNGMVHLDSEHTTIEIDDGLKIGMSLEEAKKMYSYDFEKNNYIYLFSNDCSGYLDAYENDALIMALLTDDGIIRDFWIN